MGEKKFLNTNNGGKDKKIAKEIKDRETFLGCYHNTCWRNWMDKWFRKENLKDNGN